MLEIKGENAKWKEMKPTPRNLRKTGQSMWASGSTRPFARRHAPSEEPTRGLLDYLVPSQNLIHYEVPSQPVLQGR